MGVGTEELPRSIAAVVLAAGEGVRLKPITTTLPKPLCPVGDATLLDWAIDSASTVASEVAVTVHFHEGQMMEHLARRTLKISVEPTAGIGSIGAVSLLRDWIGNRDVLLLSADAWCETPLQGLRDGWGRSTIRLWVVEREPSDVGGEFYVGAALLPNMMLDTGRAEGDYLEQLFVPKWGSGDVETVLRDEPWLDCGTPEGLWRANMRWSKGRTVLGEGARILGVAHASLIMPGATVRKGETVENCIRLADGSTLGPFG